MGLDAIEECCSSLHIIDEINQLNEASRTESLENEKNPLRTPVKSTHSTTFNVVFLIVLYTLQGFPIGMIEAFSVAMQLKGASYKSLGLLSLAFWPFSIKLIWAPIVDSFYSKGIGRRKSWLIPVQLALGFLFFYLSYEIDYVMDNVDKSSTVIWFVTILTATMTLAATQDIAVDGWALAIFHQGNVHLASICNSVGQTLGYVIANLAFLLLSSDSFCSKYLYFISNNQKLFTESQLFSIFGWCFIGITLVIAFGVSESSDNDSQTESEEPSLNSYKNVKHSYLSLWKYLNLVPIKTLIFHLLFYKVGFAAAEALTSKKLIEIGLDKNVLVLMSLPIIVLQLCLPILLDKYISKHGPLSVQSKVYPFRLAFALVSFTLVYLASYLKGTNSSSSVHTSYPFPAWFHGIVLIAFIVHQIPLYVMYVSSMGFFARISDPEHGGAQMTLLNTVCNLGSKWPNSLILLTVDLVTVKTCESSLSSSCATIIDGFYIQLAVCFLVGLGWYKLLNNSFCNLQQVPVHSWKIEPKSKLS